jgi:hypothetical protein
MNAIALETPSHNGPSAGRADAAPQGEQTARAESMQGVSNAAEFHDYADYERARCAQQGYGMRTIYRELE